MVALGAGRVSVPGGLDHDDRAQFLAGIDLIIAGVTTRLPAA